MLDFRYGVLVLVLVLHVVVDMVYLDLLEHMLLLLFQCLLVTVIQFVLVVHIVATLAGLLLMTDVHLMFREVD